MAECDELLTPLADFRNDVLALGLADRYAALIRDAEFHYRAYRAYRERRQPGDSYAAFLTRET